MRVASLSQRHRLRGLIPDPKGIRWTWGYPMSDEQVIGAVAARTGSLHSGAHARTHSLPFAAHRIENRDSAITSRSAQCANPPTHSRSTTSRNNDVRRSVPVNHGVDRGLRGVSDTVLTRSGSQLPRTHIDEHLVTRSPIQCASARARGINFQACLMTRDHLRRSAPAGLLKEGMTPHADPARGSPVRRH